MILGIESSCDETALALVDEWGVPRFQVLKSQIALHNKHGGVVPELASRSHFEEIESLFNELKRQTEEAGFDIKTLKAVAATRGPGLVGPLLVGSSFGEGLALGWGVPFVGVHHLRGHLASALLVADYSEKSEETLRERSERCFPSLVLLVSGGHSQVLVVDPDLNARQLIESVDDAAGECLDKIAKILGLPYPGGPEIENLAKQISVEGNPSARSYFQKLPKPKTSDGQFSFSGLKTAARLLIEREAGDLDRAGFAWALQKTIAEIFLSGLKRSLQTLKENPAFSLPKNLIFCGGVAANLYFRQSLKSWADQEQMGFIAPPIKYATDNGAMIAAAGWLQKSDLHLSTVEPRLPLT